MKIERLIQSIGKRCFRNCYSIAAQKGKNLTIDDLLQNDLDLQGTKKTGLRTRLNCIKRIFKANVQYEALTIAENFSK